MSLAWAPSYIYLRSLLRRLVAALLFPLRLIRKFNFCCRSRRQLEDFIRNMGVSGSCDASGDKSGGVPRVKAIFLGDEAKSKEERRLVQKLGKIHPHVARAPLFRC